MGTIVGKNKIKPQSAPEAKNHCEPFSKLQSSNSPTTAAADPRGEASILSRASFWWLVPLIILSVRRKLRHSDLYPNPPELDSEELLKRFNSYWEEEKKRISPRLWLALFRTVLVKIILQHITFFTLVVLTLGGSVLLGYLTEYITIPNEETPISPYIYAMGLSVSSFINLAMGNLTYHNGWMIGLRIKIILTGAISQKVLSLSQMTVGKVTGGHVINLASNDIRLIDDGFYALASLVVYPFLLSAATTILYFNIGVYAFVAIGVIIAFIPLQIILTKVYHKLRLKSLRISDSRIKIMSEVLSSIRVIKMYTWEYPFKHMVDNIRRKEIYILIKAAIFHSFHQSLFTNLYAVTLFITFTAIALSPTPIQFSPQKLFTTLAIIAYLRRETVIYFMVQLMKLSDFTAAIHRIQNLLCKDELATEKFNTESCKLDSDTCEKNAIQSNPSMSLKSISTSWNNGSNNIMVLSDVSCELNKEKPLMAVVGPVGAGKSSLLQCMLKELPVLNGDLTVRGSVAYASQESWLFSGTLRDNILFGMPFRSDWYNKVLNLCALEKDISILLNGDQSLVGERGVILSGGQKARVNLARAIYRNADIYLLDDPLSAVDAAVSKLILHRCIKGHLLKQGKLIVLVTHQIQYVNECDSILALKNGKMTSHDQFIEIREVDTESVTDEPQCTGVCSVSEEKVSMPQKVTEHEDNEQGGVSLSTYYHYFKTGGGYFITVLVFLFFFSVEASVVTTDWWLTKHMSNNDTNWLAVYSGLTGAVILLSFMRTFFFFILLLRASYFLHNKMFAAVLRAPIFFFDNNPVGKVLNRFSKDIGYMDDQLQIFYTLTLMMASFFCGILALAVASNPFILIAVLVLGAVFIIVRWLYVCGTRNIKQLEALARSPIFSQLSSTLQGLPVIRSYSMESAVINKFHNYQNRNSQAWYLFLCTLRWGAICNDLTCTTFLMIFALVSIPLATSFNGALLSLALTYAVAISNQAFGYIMWTSGDVESYMISTERVLGYTRLEAEAPLESKSKPLPDWPNKGHIELRNVEYRHSSSGSLVLKNISLTITASEKVGIVGRTGAGKSSLIAALFRLAEPKGSIKIDGVECLDLGLHDVRSKISIIPQEPVLFSGTIRYNLDPFEQYDDHMIWKTLEYVQLKDLIGGLEGELKAAVSEGGSNFSVGQKQLFCLARALLRNNRILVLDEATANVDMETDAIIQRVIRDHFSHCTVLAIAHRLDTVMDYDKIMVLDKGEVCEYGAPYKLMCNPESVLLQLVESTGPLAAENLKNIAAAAHCERTAS